MNSNFGLTKRMITSWKTISSNFQNSLQAQELSTLTQYSRASISWSVEVKILSISRFSSRHAVSCTLSLAGCYEENLFWTIASIWFSKLSRSLSKSEIAVQKRKNTVKVTDRGSFTASVAYRQKVQSQFPIGPSKGTTLSVTNGSESNVNWITIRALLLQLYVTTATFTYLVVKLLLVCLRYSTSKWPTLGRIARRLPFQWTLR